jgi:hypothetical protein
MLKRKKAAVFDPCRLPVIEAMPPAKETSPETFGADPFSAARSFPGFARSVHPPSRGGHGYDGIFNYQFQARARIPLPYLPGN